MAYGVGTPADDWYQIIADFDENPVKHSHPTLSTLNQLQNHSDKTRRIGASTATYQHTFYQYIPGFNGANSYSVRMFFRFHAIASASSWYLMPVIGLRCPDTGGWNTTGINNGYYLNFQKSGGQEFFQFGDRWDFSQAQINRVLVQSADPNLDADDWHAMRMDVIKEDNDQHIKAYYCKGATACGTLTDGEPVWTKMMDVIHLNGAPTPRVLQGNLTGSLTFASVVPYASGSCMWGAKNRTNNFSDQLFCDSAKVSEVS